MSFTAFYRAFIHSVIILMLVGCVNAPIELPDWDLATRTPAKITVPEELPLLCELPWMHDDCWKAVERYEVVAEGNREISLENIEALRKTERAYDAVLAGGREQQHYGVIKQQQLDRCVSDANSDKWMYRAVIVGITALAVSQ